MFLFFSCLFTTNSPDQALIERFTTLHPPIYDVYELGDDSDALHALLAGRFMGEALTHAYVEHFLAMTRLQEQQTTIVVEDVRYEDVAVLSRAGAQIRMSADWVVEGTITHRGHSHTRTNRYAAIYTLMETEKGLRIVDTRLKNLERISGRLSSGARGGMTPLELLEQQP